MPIWKVTSVLEKVFVGKWRCAVRHRGRATALLTGSAASPRDTGSGGLRLRTRSRLCRSKPRAVASSGGAAVGCGWPSRQSLWPRHWAGGSAHPPLWSPHQCSSHILSPLQMRKPSLVCAALNGKTRVPGWYIGHQSSEIL